MSSETASDSQLHETRRAISHGLAALHKEYLGKGPEKVKCYVLEDCVLVLMFEAHSNAEQTLEHGGDQLSVAKQRVRSTAAIRDLLVKEVEEATGKKVLGYMSSSQQAPSLLSHVFVLEPTDLLQPDD